MHEQTQVLSPHRLKDTNSVLETENSSNGAALQGAGVVDLRMKHHHHQPDFGTLSSFTGASGTQPLSAPNSHVVEKYLNHIESSVTTSEESDNPENEFAIQQQRTSIIPGSVQQTAPPGILTTTGIWCVSNSSITFILLKNFVILYFYSKICNYKRLNSKIF